MKRIDQLVHVHSLEEGVTESLRFVVIVVTLVLLTPATRFPVTRIPAIINIVFAPRVNHSRGDSRPSDARRSSPSD